MWGQGGEMTQALYAHMNKKKVYKKSKRLNVHHNVPLGEMSLIS
jgi:hypothetical protein